MTATATVAATFKWSPPAGLNINSGNKVIAKPAGNSVYEIKGSANNCQDSLNISIKVNPLPVINITPLNPVICKDSSLTIKAAGAKTYVWSPAKGLNTTNDSIVVYFNPNPAPDLYYTVTATDSNGCINKDSVKIAIFPNAITVTPDPVSVCAGDSVKLTANGGVSKYTWSPSTGLDTKGGSQVYVITSPVNPHDPPAPPGPGLMYIVSAKDAEGCWDTTSVSISVNNPPVFNLGKMILFVPALL